MSAYTYPQMPMSANVWYAAVIAPPVPGTPPDKIADVSLSPLRPEDYLRGTAAPGGLRVTHIIRTAPDAQMGDNAEAFVNAGLYPCTLFEVPPGSGHYYATLWYHEVGAGFANWHARIYVARVGASVEPGKPMFPGWI